MNDTLNMRAAAAAVGLSWERFRKVWPRMVETQDFPSPIYGRYWDAAAVAAWRKRRSERRAPPEGRREGDAPPQAQPPQDGGRRARSALAELRARG